MARDYNPVNICCVLDSDLAACLNFVFLRLQLVPNTLPCLCSNKWAKGRMLERRGHRNALDYKSVKKKKPPLVLAHQAEDDKNISKFFFLSLSPRFLFFPAWTSQLLRTVTILVSSIWTINMDRSDKRPPFQTILWFPTPHQKSSPQSILWIATSLGPCRCRRRNSFERHFRLLRIESSGSYKQTLLQEAKLIWIYARNA